MYCHRTEADKALEGWIDRHYTMEVNIPTSSRSAVVNRLSPSEVTIWDVDDKPRLDADRGGRLTDPKRKYKSRVSEIEYVTAIYTKVSNALLRFWTIVSDGSFDARSQIYDIEYTLFNEFPDQEMEFHVIHAEEDHSDKVPKDATRLY